MSKCSLLTLKLTFGYFYPRKYLCNSTLKKPLWCTTSWESLRLLQKRANSAWEKNAKKLELQIAFCNRTFGIFFKEKPRRPSGYRFGQIKKCDGPVSSESSNPINVVMTSQPGDNEPSSTNRKAGRGTPKQFYRSFQSGKI